MSVIRSYSFRIDLPATPVRTETESGDLTTRPQRAAGTLSADALHIAPPKKYWTELKAAVPGRLIEGTLGPDHRALYLLRLPRKWNGRLIVAAASGVTDRTTYDLYFSDYALSRGYAFAATDKGVRRAVLDGDTVLMPMTPETSLRAWAGRLEALAALAQDEARKFYGRAPEKTYAIGLSNGGYIARKAAESSSGRFDGALEISGVLWRADEGNLLRELPRALRATAQEPWDEAALARLGFAADERWKPLAAQYRAFYWEASLGVFVSDLDPEYRGALADYDFDSRPAAVKDAVRACENTGDLQVPLISISGERDYLISSPGHARAYQALVKARGKAARHEAIYVENASHIDTNAEAFPFVEPLMPRAHAAFETLVRRVEAPVRAG